MATQPDIERLLDDAIADAIGDATVLAAVEARIAAGELVAEAQAEDEAYAAELLERLELKAARVPIDLAPFRLLIDAEMRRRAAGRRRLPGDTMPVELLHAHEAAARADHLAEIAIADANRAFLAARERLLIAGAVLSVWGSDRRERG